MHLFRRAERCASDACLSVCRANDFVAFERVGLVNDSDQNAALILNARIAIRQACQASVNLVRGLKTIYDKRVSDDQLIIREARLVRNNGNAIVEPPEIYTRRRSFQRSGDFAVDFYLALVSTHVRLKNPCDEVAAVIGDEAYIVSELAERDIRIGPG